MSSAAPLPHAFVKTPTLDDTDYNGTFRSADDKEGDLHSDAWTPSQIDWRWESKAWQLSGGIYSGAQEPARDGDQKPATLMLMEERVRREEWSCEALTTPAWDINGGEQEDVRERMRGRRRRSRWQREIVYARLSAILTLRSPGGTMNGDGVEHMRPVITE